MTQAGLFDAVQAAEPRKRVRQVSRDVYRELCNTNALADSEAKVTSHLERYCDEKREYPTALELTRFMHQLKAIPREDANLVRPRLTELCLAGVVDAIGRRTCRVSGRSAHGWKIRER